MRKEREERREKTEERRDKRSLILPKYIIEQKNRAIT
jgi:hypothetical protein